LDGFSRRSRPLRELIIDPSLRADFFTIRRKRSKDRGSVLFSLSIRHPVLSQLFAAVEKDCASDRYRPVIFTLCAVHRFHFYHSYRYPVAIRDWKSIEIHIFSRVLTSVVISPTWPTDARGILRRRERPRYCSNILLSYNKRKPYRRTASLAVQRYNGPERRSISTRRGKARKRNCAFRLRKRLVARPGRKRAATPSGNHAQQIGKVTDRGIREAHNRVVVKATLNVNGCAALNTEI